MKTHAHLRFPHALALGFLLAGACVFRLILAPQPGLDFDLGTNQGWAKSAVELGLARSYSEQVNGNMLPNYPPFSLIVFASAGHAYRALVSPTYDTTLVASRIFIKIPGILADIVTALILALVIGRWRGRAQGLLAAGIVALHPAIFYESAIWGQTDSIHSLFLLGTLLALSAERPGLGGALATLAFLTKAQTVALAPLLLTVYLLRPRWLLSGFIGCLLILIAVLFPFALGGALDDIVNVYTGSVGYNAIISSSAYNFWWALLADSAWGKSDTDVLFGLVTYRTAGFLIFGALLVTTLWLLRERLKLRDPFHKRLAILSLLGGLSAAAFFLFLTEMHERYMFPFVVLALPAAFLSRRAATLYGFVSFLFFLNLLGFLPWTTLDRALHSEFPSLDVLFASLQVFLFILWMRLTLAYRSERALAPIPAPVTADTKPRWVFRWSALLRWKVRGVARA